MWMIAPAISLSAWTIEDDLAYQRESRGFKWEPGSPSYDYATFSVHARRHVSFHLARFFLPLFLIVAIVFGQFWIDPVDLNSQITLGVTCLLAVVAQQLAEGIEPAGCRVPHLCRPCVRDYTSPSRSRPLNPYTPMAWSDEASGTWLSRLIGHRAWPFPLAVSVGVICSGDRVVFARLDLAHGSHFRSSAAAARAERTVAADDLMLFAAADAMVMRAAPLKPISRRNQVPIAWPWPASYLKRKKQRGGD